MAIRLLPVLQHGCSSRSARPAPSPPRFLPDRSRLHIAGILYLATDREDVLKRSVCRFRSWLGQQPALVRVAHLATEHRRPNKRIAEPGNRVHLSAIGLWSPYAPDGEFLRALLL
jgi:hypothetical protein